MAKGGAIPPPVALLTSGTPVAKENAAWALESISENYDHQGRVSGGAAHPDPSPTRVRAARPPPRRRVGPATPHPRRGRPCLRCPPLVPPFPPSLHTGHAAHPTDGWGDGIGGGGRGRAAPPKTALRCVRVCSGGWVWQRRGISKKIKASEGASTEADRPFYLEQDLEEAVGLVGMWFAHGSGRSGYLPAMGNCDMWAIATWLLCGPTCDMGSCDTSLCGPTCDTLKQVQIPTCPCLLTFRIMNYPCWHYHHVYTIHRNYRSWKCCGSYRRWYLPCRIPSRRNFLDIQVGQVGDCDIALVWPNLRHGSCDTSLCGPTCDVAIAHRGGGSIF